MRSTWLQVAVPRADGYSLRNNYPSMYRFSCAIGCNCFCAFNLSSCFIPYIISGIRQCSYVVSFISSHLLFNCDWFKFVNCYMHCFQFRITFTCSMALLDLLLLWWIHFKQSAKSHWFLFAYRSGLASAELLNAGLLCVIRCWHCTFRRYACTAVNIDDLTSQTTSNNKHSANVEISMRGCYAWR
jgi:hypothetical protein